jgi:hypothetical protein
MPLEFLVLWKVTNLTTHVHVRGGGSGEAPEKFLVFYI